MSQIENDDPNAPAEELSLRGQIEKAIEETNAKTDIEQPIPAQTPEDRQRDEQGRFAKAEADKARKDGTLTLPAKSGDQLQQPTAAVGDGIGGGTTPKAPDSAAKPGDAPSGWSEPIRRRFNEIPEDIRAEIVKRDKEIQRSLTAQDEDRLYGKTLREQTAPYMATILAEGATPVLAYGDYLNNAHILRTGTPEAKFQLLISTARRFNVPLNLPSQASPQQALPPQIQHLMTEIDGLKRERHAEIQQRQAQEHLGLQSEIEAFATDPAHPHFNKLRPLVGQYLLDDRASSLDEAYKMVVDELGLGAIQQTQSGKSLTDIAARTQAAKRAAGSVTGSPGLSNGLDPAAKDRPLRDEIRAQLRAAAGRV